jgi:hypothetical protein
VYPRDIHYVKNHQDSSQKGRYLFVPPSHRKFVPQMVIEHKVVMMRMMRMMRMKRRRG